MRHPARPHALLLFGIFNLLGASCTPPADDDDATAADDDDASVNDDDSADDDDSTPDGPCDDTGLGLNRFSEEAAARGLNVAFQDPTLVDDLTAWNYGGHLAALDLDADGDTDLIAAQHTLPPVLYLNDGTANFVGAPLAVQLPNTLLPVVNMAFGDLDGDGDLDLVLAGLHRVATFLNDGALNFGPSTEIFDLDATRKLEIGMVALADLESDGDLDAVIATIGVLMDAQGEPLSENGAPDVVLLSRTTFADTRIDLQVGHAGPGSTTLAVMVTDLDRDGSLDILAPSEGQMPTSIWKQEGVDGDGLPIYVDRASELGFLTRTDARSIDVADLNGDAQLDYCMSSTGPPYCALSQPEGGFVLGRGDIGLTDPKGSEGNVTWGVELADFDNSGTWDFAAAGGATFNMFDEGPDPLPMPDQLFTGFIDGTFGDVSEAAGFDDPRTHLGLVSADLDGDGFLELVVGGPAQTPLLFMNRCGNGAWLEVEARGAPGNEFGFGAIVDVEAGALRWTREIQGVRGAGQSPPVAHFGLGSERDVTTVTVTWPDGTVTQTAAPAVDQRIVVSYE